MGIRNWLLFEKEDLIKRIRSYSKLRFILLLSSFFGFGVSLFWLWQKTFLLRVKTYDQATAEFLFQLKSPFLMNFFDLVSYLGSEFFVVGAFFILALILIIKRRKRAAAASLLSLGGSLFFIYFLKSVFGRLRPNGCLASGDCLSFPSGHATLSFYFYGLLLYLIFRFLPVSLKTFMFCSLIIAILVGLIALSRLYLGVHYLSDIFGGFFLGGAWLLLAVFLIDVLY